MTWRATIAIDMFANTATLLAATLLAFPCRAAELEGWWRFAESDGDESADCSGRGRAAFVDTLVGACCA